MQRATGTKMHVDQARKTLEIEGTPRQLDHVKRRLSRLLERVEAQVQNQAMGFVDEKAAEMQRAMARQMERQKMAAKEAEVGARRNI